MIYFLLLKQQKGNNFLMKQMIYFLLLKQQKGNNFLLQEDFLLVVFSSCFRFQSLLSFLNIYLYLDQVTLFKVLLPKST